MHRKPDNRLQYQLFIDMKALIPKGGGCGATAVTDYSVFMVL